MPPPVAPIDLHSSPEIPNPNAGRLPDDDLEPVDSGEGPTSCEPAVQIPQTQSARPWHGDPNYQTLCQMRDEMALIARSGRVTPKDRIAAARAAMSAASEVINWFGVETGDATDAAEQAAAQAGQEAARRAVNTGLFGSTSPRVPEPWATSPGNPNPRRRTPDGA